MKCDAGNADETFYMQEKDVDMKDKFFEENTEAVDTSDNVACAQSEGSQENPQAEEVTLAKNEIDMTSGNLAKKILKFAIPVILSSELQLLYNAADLIVCGMFGSLHSVGAISATNSLINLIVQLFLGLAVGANVLMSRCVGAKQREKGQRVVYSSMILSVAVGVFIGAFGTIFSRYFLKWMGTQEEVIDLSTTYLTIYFLGVPFSLIYNFGASLLRAVGDTKRPFCFLAVSGIFNVGFNLFFVIVCKLDVAGVALGTIISQAISAACIVVCLLRYKGFFHFSFKEMRFYKTEALEVTRIGIPAGLQGAIFSISNVLIQSGVNSLGTNTMDGNGASGSIEGFVYAAMNSVAQAAIAFVSANYGANNWKNIRRSILYCLMYILTFGISIGVLVAVFGRQLLSIYLSKNPEALEIAYGRLLVISLTYFTCGVMDLFAYALRGIGYSVLPTVLTLCGACGTRILWIFLVFPLEQFHNLQGLVVSYPISWVLTASISFVFCVVLYNKKRRLALQNMKE